MTKRAVTTGVGHYLPDRIFANSEFESRIDTTDGWIRTRTGIERRHFAAEGQTTADLAARAARAALADAGVAAEALDAIILATSTSDRTFPSTATAVQAEIGAGGFAFDIQAVCAGFVYALALADSLVTSGRAGRVLVIGAEVFSRLLDWSDRGTCVLFGDGAGAVILEARDGTGTNADRGILAVDLHSDGRLGNLLYADGGTLTGRTGVVRMQGREVFRHAVEKLAETSGAALARAGLGTEDVDWIIPHQANIRIIEATARRMRVPMERVVVTIADHGNTSAASIPLALSVGKARGQIRPGNLCVIEAIGGGLAWGAAALRW